MQVWQSTLRRWAEILSNRVVYWVFALFVFMSVLIGPFGTFESLQLTQRFGFWFVAHAVGWSIALLIIVPVRLWLEQLNIPRIVAFTVASMLANIAVTPFFLVLLKLETNASFDFSEVVIDFLMVAPVVTVLTFVAIFWTGLELFPDKRDTRLHAARKTAGDCPLQTRIPREKRGILYALVAQDHYVEIITDKGSALSLMRLSDAIQHTDPEDGLRIHRSAWISRHGFAKTSRDGRNVQVRLHSGRVLPVARSREAALRAFLTPGGPEEAVTA